MLSGDAPEILWKTSVKCTWCLVENTGSMEMANAISGRITGNLRIMKDAFRTMNVRMCDIQNSHRHAISLMLFYLYNSIYRKEIFSNVLYLKFIS